MMEAVTRLKRWSILWDSTLSRVWKCSVAEYQLVNKLKIMNEDYRFFERVKLNARHVSAAVAAAIESGGESKNNTNRRHHVPHLRPELSS